MNRQEFCEYCGQRGFSDEQTKLLVTGIEHGFQITPFARPECPAECMKEILLGMLHEVDVSVFANKNLDYKQMHYLRLMLESHVFSTSYLNGFSGDQLEQIYNGLLKKLDVSLYACPDYSAEKMCQCYTLLTLYPESAELLSFADYDEYQLYQINSACKDSLDIRPLIAPDFNDSQMRQIRLALSHEVDIECFANTNYTAKQMEQIRIGLEKLSSVDEYADPKYTWLQMQEIRLGKEQAVDISQYAFEYYSEKIMRLIRLGLLDGVDTSRYARKGISYEEAKQIYDSLIEMKSAITDDPAGSFNVQQVYISNLESPSELYDAYSKDAVLRQATQIGREQNSEENDRESDTDVKVQSGNKVVPKNIVTEAELRKQTVSRQQPVRMSTPQAAQQVAQSPAPRRQPVQLSAQQSAIDLLGEASVQSVERINSF